MTDLLDKAVSALAEKLNGASFGETVKFEIEGEGAVFVDGAQDPPKVFKSDAEAAVTISATKEIFQEILSGALDPMSAAMRRQIKIDGDLGAAMKLAGALS